MIVEGAVVMIENIVRPLSHPDSRSRTRPPRRRSADAAHEVQRPVFYSIAIIITAYLPIFTLQRVEGRLFKPMAWTVAFALLGALMFSMLVAPVLASVVFPKGTKEWHNPLHGLPHRSATHACLGVAIRWRWVTLAAAVLTLGGHLPAEPQIGSEFLPHLDEGAIWVRGTLAPSTGPDGRRRAWRTRRAMMLCSFPEVPHAPARWAGPTTEPILPDFSIPSISSI